MFEPNATSVEKAGFGYVVAYIGEYGGEVPYTAYNAKKSYIENNPDVIESFIKAINKGLEYVEDNEPVIVAQSISTFFPDTSLNDLTTMIKRYKEADAWRETTNVIQDEWKHIQDIMIASGELDEYAPYEKIIYNG